MDGVNPVLECVWFVEEGIRRGDSVRDALLRWTDAGVSSRHASCAYSREFRLQVLEVLRKTEGTTERNRDPRIGKKPSLYRESFFQILAAGFRGEAVLADLVTLKADIQNQLDLDMKSHVETLPFKMLLPLLMFLFPAFLILLFGPITRAFLQSLS